MTEQNNPKEELKEALKEIKPEFPRFSMPPTAMPVAVVEQNNAQNRLSEMLKKSGYRSPMLERFAGKRLD